MLLFLLQLVILVGFSLYCDCPGVFWLEYKLAMFFISILTLLMASCLSVSLLWFELIGLLSFRLIGHYFVRQAAQRGSLIALNTNRAGDILLAFWVFRSLASVYDTSFVNPLFVDLMLLSLAVKSISVFSFV